MLSHAAAVDRDLRPARAVLEAAGARAVLLFAPEHGFDATAQDMVSIDHARGEIPIQSLYGERFEDLSPDPTRLVGLDLVVVDLVDVGSRYYTFVWTALLTLQAAARAGVPVLVLDRPNPIGGVNVEGAPNRPGFTSFVGLEPVAVRHGMTIGETLRLCAARRGFSRSLEVLPMQGWSRDRPFDCADVPWVQPSPNMPTRDTALVYPGACLVEATNASEGRGTTRPFEIVGAPWIDGPALARRLDSEKLPGVRFRPLAFEPTFHKHAGRRCGGVQIHPTDRDAFRPYRTGLALIAALREIGGDAFEWRREPYEFVADIPAIDLLTGGDEVRRAVESGAKVDDVLEALRPQEDAFRAERTEYLLY